MTEAEIKNALVKRHGVLVQEKLRRAKVAIAGLGGLGSNVAVSLARIGVGHLHLIDFDKVDITNLNRQHYFLRHLGMNKTEALREQLMQINPYLNITADCIRITRENVKTLFDRESIICEAFDVPEEKAMLVNEVLCCMPEKILVAASGMAGYGSSNQIHTRKINNHFYLCGDEVTENKKGQGLMAPRAALCAAHQSNLITKLIITET